MVIARIFVGIALSCMSLTVLGVIFLTATGVVGWQPSPKAAIVRIVYAK